VHTTFQRGRLAVAAASIALIASACSAPSGASDATIGFVTPSDGATVTVPFDVELEASVPLGEPETGNQHAHLYFDSSTDSSDYDIVYGTAAEVTRQLGPGEHTIIVALANPDHGLAGPTQQITVMVGGDSRGATDGASPAPTPPASIDY
jgi:hypothetical protein